MTRCTRSHCGGQILGGSCLLCGYAVAEDEVSLLDKMLSNVTPESLPNCGPRPVVSAAEGRARLDRVMARIRREVAP